DELVRLRKRPLGHREVLARERHPRALGAWMQPAAVDHHAGGDELLVEFAHVGQQLPASKSLVALTRTMKPISSLLFGGNYDAHLAPCNQIVHGVEIRREPNCEPGHGCPSDYAIGHRYSPFAWLSGNREGPSQGKTFLRRTLDQAGCAAVCWLHMLCIAFCISAGVTSRICVAIDQRWPNGSSIWP